MNNTSEMDKSKIQIKPVISRDQLRFMRDLTMQFAKSKSANSNWKKHLIDLSNQCDILDAVMSRANLKEMILEGKKIQRVIETVEDTYQAGRN